MTHDPGLVTPGSNDEAAAIKDAMGEMVLCTCVTYNAVLYAVF
jgi:hypothetical protein